jgi:hypothetical protein
MTAAFAAAYRNELLRRAERHRRSYPIRPAAGFRDDTADAPKNLRSVLRHAVPGFAALVATAVKSAAIGGAPLSTDVPFSRGGRNETVVP